MRLFIALNLPTSARERLTDDLAALRRTLPGVRWVHPETLHLTLIFLGELEDAGRRAAEAALRRVAAAHAPLELRFTHLGVFPNRSRPRVIWAGVADPESVAALHRALVREGLRPAGAAAYHPHLTLGRVPPPAAPDVRRALPGLLERPVALSAPIHSLELMRSTLAPTGARYEVLLSAPLNRGEGV
ncbi:RNA 2',3'-cyclic phosphodiesterase [Truepera radiovictrix]|uniref:RNA 2',3'-cyclic phosphodiesterase n=1 Tax=Truepera radiovictrix (strain DSM 17093 / CIP 108686 / LMG 22925 / RQ-24) TaxID=649638 RepID=D7CUU4_TRURR|nr:RNA 2',3'-cyclic phosphodiesterase [Truepera radiovictrix]ADI14085.1 2'-5' RNA ligase [Truepera radiovictrix DSM 17093]WMT57353.1 RNA 2',3'-cyclic phosphodiesterase [Truepera radiovictrix]